MEKKTKTKDIRQSVTFKATPHEIYEMLMDSKKHSDFSGQGARISRKVGGKFTAFDGWAEGKNLRLVQDKLIVQLWRADDWPKGHYSTVTFKISKSGNGAKLEFTQVGVPAQFHRDISGGWKEFYWESMKRMIG